MIDRLAKDSGVSREQLLKEAQEVHQRHGTSEYAFLIEELPSLRRLHPSGDLATIFDGAIHDFRIARKNSLKLFPGVEETLKQLKRSGVLLVGYTESMAFYTNFRIRRLKLDGLLDYLYSPPDHDLPDGLTPEQIRKYPSQHYDLNFTEHKHTPIGELKPNPKLLLDIIADIGARADQCLYIGDRKMKDIAMAQSVGVVNALAGYGKAQHTDAYELLRRVTHWSPEVVAKEKEIDRTASVVPEIVLDRSYNQIFEFFDFVPFSNKQLDNEFVKHVVEIWKKTVDVQQHFNDIEMKIRNAAITVLAALLGASGFALRENMNVFIWDTSIPVAVLLLLTALIAWLAFYFMDRVWYHRLLIGAVTHGLKVEAVLKETLPIGLAESIGSASKVTLLRWTGCVTGKERKIEIRSNLKMDIFYNVVTVVIGLLAAIIFIFKRDSVP